VRDWFRRVFLRRPDRVERLLRSCEGYYHAGDRDIAVLLLREVEKELVKAPLFSQLPP
jgi:hypothetical protein